MEKYNVSLNEELVEGRMEIIRSVLIDIREEIASVLDNSDISVVNDALTLIRVLCARAEHQELHSRALLVLSESREAIDRAVATLEDAKKAEKIAKKGLAKVVRRR